MSEIIHILFTCNYSCKFPMLLIPSALLSSLW